MATEMEVDDYLQNGGFAGSLTGKPHSRIPFDQVIEMTINRSCKDVGGLSRNTENPGAMERWTRIHHHIVALREHQNKKIHKKTKQTHVDLGSGRIERDEHDVANIKTCITAWLPELWKNDHPITNFATGEIATAEMTSNILDLQKRGEVARDEFISRFLRKRAPNYHIMIQLSDRTLNFLRRRRIRINTQSQRMKVNLSQKFLQHSTRKNSICAKSSSIVSQADHG